jgi:hypothetical protein
MVEMHCFKIENIFNPPPPPPYNTNKRVRLIHCVEWEHGRYKFEGLAYALIITVAEI